MEKSNLSFPTNFADHNQRSESSRVSDSIGIQVPSPSPSVSVTRDSFSSLRSTSPVHKRRGAILAPPVSPITKSSRKITKNPSPSIPSAPFPTTVAAAPAARLDVVDLTLELIPSPRQPVRISNPIVILSSDDDDNDDDDDSFERLILSGPSLPTPPPRPSREPCRPPDSVNKRRDDEDDEDHSHHGPRPSPSLSPSQATITPVPSSTFTRNRPDVIVIDDDVGDQEDNAASDDDEDNEGY